MDKRKKAAKYVAEKLISGERGLAKLKGEASSRFGLGGHLKNSEILKEIPKRKRREGILNLLKLKPSRTLSGVTPIAVMTKSDCPHGSCLYCPRGEEAAQSYTGEEPASLRARQNFFDPERQVNSRLRQYKEIGHPTDKCELILMGGTFIAQPEKKVRSFVKRCFDAFNGKKSSNLKQAMRMNEKAKRRVIGVTFETRPDYAKRKHVDLMLEMGATRVEIGVQTLSDSVYKKVDRGHLLEDVVSSTKICKDAGLKVCYHMMPGLFADKKKDVAMFKKLFSDSRFMPDMLKIYPCLVMEGTKLHKMWREGKYKPYDTLEAAVVVSECMRHVPEYVRVMRVQRDIPSNLVAAGVKKSNLRQYVENEMEKKKISCREIRCREVGRGEKISWENVELVRKDYSASGGKEIFLSFEDVEKGRLVGFLRLRMPGRTHRKELSGKCSIVRELHVYGGEIEIGKRGKGGQHAGYGGKLLKEAERISKEEFKAKKIAVTSGVGAREYYRKFGYVLAGVYMSKKI